MWKYRIRNTLVHLPTILTVGSVGPQGRQGLHYALPHLDVIDDVFLFRHNRVPLYIIASIMNHRHGPSITITMSSSSSSSDAISVARYLTPALQQSAADAKMAAEMVSEEREAMVGTAEFPRGAALQQPASSVAGPAKEYVLLFVRRHLFTLAFCSIFTTHGCAF